MSICRAHRNEAPLHSNNRTRHILICWFKRGFVNPPVSPARGFIFILTHTQKKTHTHTCWKGQWHKHKKTQQFFFFHSQKYLDSKTTGNHVYSKMHIHVRTSSYMYTNTEAAVIWGMLNIYLSCLPGWLSQSALSLWLSINLRFQDSSLPGCHSETENEHVHCNKSPYAVIFHVVLLTALNLAQNTGACQFSQAFGRETNTWTCNAVTPWWMSTTTWCLKAPFNPSTPENWCSTFTASSMWPAEWRPLQKSGFMAMCCCNTEMFRRSPNGLNRLIDLHKINNVDAQKRAGSSCGVTFHCGILGWWLHIVRVPPIPVVFLANKWDWSMNLK